MTVELIVSALPGETRAAVLRDGSLENLLVNCGLAQMEMEEHEDDGYNEPTMGHGAINCHSKTTASRPQGSIRN